MFTAASIHDSQDRKTAWISFDGDYAKENKPDWERQILYGITYIANKKINSLEICFQELWWEGTEEMQIKVYELALIIRIYMEDLMCYD